MKKKICALIAAGGRGERMGGPKQFIRIKGEPMLLHTIRTFESSPMIDMIVLVVSEDNMMNAQKLVGDHGLSKVGHIVPGGDRRQDSVYAGLKAIPPDFGHVLIQDGARPLTNMALIGRIVEALSASDAVIAAVPIKDTVKEADTDGCILRTLKRDMLWAAQTPQAFKLSLALRAYERAAVDGAYFTDDAALVENLGVKVKMVMGDFDNIKVTTPVDVSVVEAVLSCRPMKGEIS